MTTGGEKLETERTTWSRKTKDAAPRGVFKHPSGVWAIRYACGAGCAKHEERIGPLKSDAARAYHERRARAHAEPGWCPAVERRKARERVRAEKSRQRTRMTFTQYAEDYLAWSASVHRSQRTAQSEVRRLVSLIGETPLDEITSAQVERCLSRLGETIAPASVNRLRDRLSGMLKRARRLGLMTENPVKDIPKLREAGGRLAFLNLAGEEAVLAALPPERRPLVTLAINTGLRLSEQSRLRWITWTCSRAS